MVPPQTKKRTQGRKKIEMKVIEDENARVVTFSKRRSSLFKKATEISVLCGAQVALIIFSIGGRAHSYGHPSIRSVVDRFFNRNPMPNVQDPAPDTQANPATLKDLCDKSGAELEAKKRKAKEIQEALDNSAFEVSEEHINTLDIHQLKYLKQTLEKLRENLQFLATQPQVALIKPPPDSMEIVEPSKVIPPTVGQNSSQPLPICLMKKVDLANVEKKDAAAGDASPIPADWLAL